MIMMIQEQPPPKPLHMIERLLSFTVQNMKVGEMCDGQSKTSKTFLNSCVSVSIIEKKFEIERSFNIITENRPKLRLTIYPFCL